MLRLIIKSKSPGKNSMNDPWHLVNSSLPKRLENHPNNMIFQVFFPSLSQSQKHHEGRLQQQHEHFQTWSSQPQDVTMFFWRIETIPNHSYPSGGWLNWFNPKIYDFMVVGSSLNHKISFNGIYMDYPSNWTVGYGTWSIFKWCTY